MLDDSAIAESRPLLDLEEEEATASNRRALEKNPTPLPWLQLSTLFLVDLCAALSASTMLPYITEVRFFHRLSSRIRAKDGVDLLSSLLADWISSGAIEKRSDTL